MTKLRFGIAGHPRGATHFAAALFDIGHESLQSPRGIADFLLAMPVWPPPHIFRLFMRTDELTSAVRDTHDFDHKILVTREPWRVLQTCQALYGRQIAYAMGSLFPDLQITDTASVTIDDIAKLMVRWYQVCDAWTDERFQAEAPEAIANKYNLTLTREPRNVSRATKMPLDDIKATLSSATIEQVEELREYFGYA